MFKVTLSEIHNNILDHFTYMSKMKKNKNVELFNGCLKIVFRSKFCFSFKITSYLVWYISFRVLLYFFYLKFNLITKI